MPSNLEDNFESLVRLGISPNQSKVYLALVRLGQSSASRLYKKSEIPREEVYRKLHELQELGFVESSLTKPRMYRALPLKDVLQILLKRKAEEISALQKESEKLLKLATEKTSEDSIFHGTLFVPKKHALLEKARKELINLERSLDCVLSWDKCIGWFTTHNDIFLNLLKRNIQIRWVIEKNENDIFFGKIDKLPNSNLFKVRTISNCPESCLGIFDKKILLLDTSPSSGFIQTPILWSDNASLVSLAQNYFDVMWKNSQNVQR